MEQSGGEEDVEFEESVGHVNSNIPKPSARDKVWCFLQEDEVLFIKALKEKVDEKTLDPSILVLILQRRIRKSKEK